MYNLTEVQFISTLLTNWLTYILTNFVVAAPFLLQKSVQVFILKLNSLWVTTILFWVTNDIVYIVWTYLEAWSFLILMMNFQVNHLSTINSEVIIIIMWKILK